MAARPGTSSYMAFAALIVVLGTVTGWVQRPNFSVFMPAAPLMGDARHASIGLMSQRPAVVGQQSSCFLAAFGAAAAAAAAAGAAAVGAPRKPNKAGAGRLHAVQLCAEVKESEVVAQDDGEEYDSDDDEEDDDDEDEDGLTYDEDGDDDLYLEEDDDDERPSARCKARFLRGSPQKFRRVLWQIRGRSYREALMILEFMPFRHCKPILSALQSAAANAQNHQNMDKSRLYVKSCKADAGPSAQRMRPISKGQSHPFKRRSTHLEIHVAEMTEAELAKKKNF